LGLAVLAALPAFAVMLSMAHQWRAHEVLDAQERARDLVRRAVTMQQAHIDMDAQVVPVLERFAERIPTDSLGVPPGSLVAIFNHQGHLIAQYPPASPTAGTSAERDKLIGAMLTAKSEGTVEAAAFDDVRRAYAFSPLKSREPGQEPYIAVGIPVAAATALADQTLVRDFGVFAIAIGLVMAIAWVAGERLVVRHVRELADVARRIGEGDLTARVGVTGRPAELSALAESFDRMAQTLQAREREITSQRDRISAQERRMRAILDSSNEGIGLRDRSGRLLYVSPSTGRLLGYDPSELLGRDTDEYVHAQDRPYVRALLDDLMRHPGAAVSAIFRVRHKNGSWRWIAMDLQNLLDEPSVGAVLANYRDVTAYREAQEALRQTRDQLETRVRQRTFQLVKANDALRLEIAERKKMEETLQRLSHVVEQTADSVLVTDRNGIVEYVNPAFEAMTGFTRQEIVGKTPHMISSGLHDRHFFAHLWETILAGRVFRTVVKNKKKDGRVFDEDQTITPMRDDRGAITHFISTGRDVTERKRTEHAIRRLNVLLEQETTRIANLLHDEAGQFLTSAHIMIADVARELPPQARERLHEVRQHLDQVEGQLRTISHDLHPRILKDLGLVGTFRFRAEAFERRTGVKTAVKADRDYRPSQAVQAALYRLVQEGLTNAAKHARAKTITISLTDDGHSICCALTDNGVGFDVDEMAQRTTVTSLGLQSMRDRIEALGGTFEINSAPGTGTTLRAHVPMEA
jgi:PAS domain S-box-containing protein